ncbi:nicotinate-nucleotide adenylyltransferase [Paraglaciecola sp. MB-3u-78]|uniref:nicotinate-nucleotide adenylyltransferase n=1 Tax=Paraglaciecola sp. MB-3u-78 TaxID=2058332 RepID=UPI000C321C72|nr:nicotinate-nucleotide adenylyltransferase [Paraglaciecola sp. MB-3u-78]PKG99060.1 nicotinate-nucleotide adenylyltransferase [Paraglaciecola sp. MB-3u-78]
MQLTPPLGIFGGTFDPIHNGHIYPVLEGAEKANIKKVALMPCYIPSHKNPAAASSEDRLKMVELVCADHGLFYADPRDISRGIPTFSVDSLTEIRKAMPNTPLCFFIGTDSLQSLFTWHQWPTLFDLCHFVVCERNAESIKTLNSNTDNSLKRHGPQLQELLKKRQVFNPMALHSRLAGHIYVANTQSLTVSSSKIRQQLANNQSVDSFLPPKIIDYIQQHKLYQTRADFC